MNIPLLLIILVLLIYLFVSFLYCKKMYLSIKVEKELAKKINKAYTITTIIFAFIIVSKFAFEQSISKLSFDSSFIINNYIAPILEQKTLTLEIILSTIVFIVFLFNRFLLPLLLNKLFKPTKEKFLKTICDPNEIYKLLPEPKLRNCIYSKTKKNNQETITDLITTFKSLYIAKKVYLDSSRNSNMEISKRILDFKDEIIADNTNFVLLGDAGCGKSTLLFKTFIDIIEDNPSSNKIIPIFVDLKSINKNNSLANEIINKYIDLFLEQDSLKYYNNNNKTINKENIFSTIFEELINDGYKFIFMLDSLDECSKKNNITEDFKYIIEQLDNLNASFKFIIALRKSAYDNFINLFSKKLYPYNVLKIRDYDKSEIKTYIEKLLEQGKIKIEDIEDIYRNIEIVTFDEKVNPFIVSMIVNGFISKKRIEFKSKVVDILKDNISRLILDVNESRGCFQYNEKTYEIIGATTQFKKSILGYDYHKYASFLNSNTAVSDYENDLKELKDNTYLVDSDGYFYQKIFGDFYCASFLLNTINCKNNIHNIEYTAMIDEIFTKGNYAELFEYLILLTDNNDEELINSPLDIILNHIFKKYELRKDKQLYDAIFEKFKIMLESLAKYSTKKIVKDKLPLNINATSNAKNVTIYLYKKYFNFLINNNLDVDYGYFYHLVSIVDNHDLAIKAILSLEDKKIMKRMLSIVRDSYLNLNYQNKPILFFKEYSFSTYEKELIKSIILDNKEENKLSLRELLDLSFYSDYLLDYETLNIDLSKKLFPTIYNLDLFILNYNDKKDNFSTKVTNKDNLIYDSEISYNSVKFIDTSDLEKKKINLNNNILSLFIYTSSSKTITNNIKNSEYIRSIDIDEGIEVLSENCFNKSINLKNIILPSTLKDIQDFALYECHHLQSLIIPDGVTNLGESFIEDCFNLEQVALPKSLKTMGQYAFEDDTSLTIINFKNNNIELKEGLFKGCMSLTDFNSLNLSIDTSSIPKQLFLECINLQEVDMSNFNKLESIGSYAFARCNSLTKITLPESLKEIKMLVFYECDNLKEVILNSVPTCSKQVFANLNHDVKITINLKDSKIEKIINTNDQFNELILSLNGQLIDDEFIDGIVFERKEDETCALDYCFITDLKEFKVTEYQNITVSSCNIGALGNQELLNDVIFNENLCFLSEWLFEDCYSLYTVDLEKTKIQILNKHIFENCYALKEVLLPSTLKVIDDYAFENCNDLNRINFAGMNIVPRTLTIPVYIEKIGECAFHNCKDIHHIIIKGNTKISSFAFDGLVNLKSIIFADDYDFNNIEDGAFVNCNNSVDIIAMKSKKELKRLFNTLP